MEDKDDEARLQEARRWSASIKRFDEHGNLVDPSELKKQREVASGTRYAQTKAVVEGGGNTGNQSKSDESSPVRPLSKGLLRRRKMSLAGLLLSVAVVLGVLFLHGSLALLSAIGAVCSAMTIWAVVEWWIERREMKRIRREWNEKWRKVDQGLEVLEQASAWVKLTKLAEKIAHKTKRSGRQVESEIRANPERYGFTAKEAKALSEWFRRKEEHATSTSGARAALVSGTVAREENEKHADSGGSQWAARCQTNYERFESARRRLLRGSVTLWILVLAACELGNYIMDSIGGISRGGFEMFFRHLSFVVAASLGAGFWHRSHRLGIGCKHCGRFISARQSWYCGFCKASHDWPNHFFEICHNCENYQRGVQCPSCKGVNFVFEHQGLKRDIAWIVGDSSPENLTEVEDRKETEKERESTTKRKQWEREREAERVRGQNERIAQIEYQTDLNRRLTNELESRMVLADAMEKEGTRQKQSGEVSKSEKERLSDDLKRHTNKLLLVEKIGSEEKLTIDEKYPHNPELREKLHMAVNAWLETHLP